MRRGLLLAVAATLLAFAPGAGATSPSGFTAVEASFSSTAGTLGYEVYLPPGYETSGLRYPVLYYLHGLPAGPTAFRSAGYVVQAAAADGLQAIIVAPQGAAARDADPEYLDAGPGNDWETAIATQLPHLIDSLYRTISDRSGRALVGVSAGGYGAMLLALHHLGAFSAAESWSGYFHPTDPTGRFSISRRPWLSAHAFVGSLRRAFAVHQTFLGFYVGNRDRNFRAENVAFARELSRARVPFLFRMYPAGHEQSLWTAEAGPWLATLAAHLAAPQPAD